MKKNSLILLLFLFIGTVGAQNIFLDTRNINMQHGNVTNATYINSSYICLVSDSCISSWNAINMTDTNESTRFNNLVGNCGSGNYIQNITVTGLKQCNADKDTTYSESDKYLTLIGTAFGFSESVLNTTIISVTATDYFNVSSVGLIRGTNTTSWTNILAYNGNSYNVTESVGAIGLDVRFNFTGISKFNQIVFQYKNSIGESHISKLQIWDYIDSGWKNYRTFEAVSDWTIIDITVFDYDSHVSGGVVQARVVSEDNGNTAHKHYFDWVQLSNGFGTTSSTEVDPISVHRDQLNTTQIYFDTVLNLNVSYLQSFNTDTGGWTNSSVDTNTSLNVYINGGNSLIVSGDIVANSNIVSYGSINSENVYTIKNGTVLSKDISNTILYIGNSLGTNTIENRKQTVMDSYLNVTGNLNVNGDTTVGNLTASNIVSTNITTPDINVTNIMHIGVGCMYTNASGIIIGACP